MKESKGPVVIQRRLVLEPKEGQRQEQKQIYYIFPKDTIVYTVVWPNRFRRGALQTELQARKQEGKEVAGYPAWTAEGIMELYLDGERWRRRRGTSFGAPKRLAQKIKLD